jgi:hypothetical protein
MYRRAGTSFFKVGDYVRIRKGLEERTYDDLNSFNYSMRKHEGELHRILKVCGSGYLLEGRQWYWTDSMLEIVEREDALKEIIKNRNKERKNKRETLDMLNI